MLSFKCKDLGLSCGFEATAETEEEMMRKLMEHADKVHCMKAIPPALVEQVKKKVVRS